MEKKNETLIGVPMEGLAELSRVAAAQGAVLLKNEEAVLPLRKGERISIFGRSQIDYYRSGTGSGGAVHVAYTTNLLDGFANAPEILINQELVKTYKDFIEAHPFDNGGGAWAAEPWNQEEMLVTDEIAKRAALASEKALIVIGRTAGEDKDNADLPGSYRFTKDEETMLETVCRHFKQVVVALNVSNIVDMSWMEKPLYQEKVKAVIYLWHGGIEGGNAAVDVLTGRVNPSGKLTDTIAYELDAYPSTKGYGNREKSYYIEDIYVGYRYFETFAPDKVQFPFGFGLSYTEFLIDADSCIMSENEASFEVKVKNIGNCAGKEVVQVYVKAPQGHLGKPSKSLVGFQKTKLLEVGEVQNLKITVPMSRLASYDESASAYVLEEGSYYFYLGNSVRQLEQVRVVANGKEDAGFTLAECKVIESLSQAAAPTEGFERIKPGKEKEDGTYEIMYEKVPLNTVDINERIIKNLPAGYEITGNRGIKFQDVLAKKAGVEEFVAQFTKEELAIIVRGEGMCSPKVTPGTAAAFGGVSDSLLEYGIPIGCAADGPSGIRMDTGAKATQLPIGTLLACTWDTDLVEELFTLQGQELLRNEIDTLLGPGINVHRNPLNGRNFEYFSEDSYVTGAFATATVRGIAKHGAEGTVKHFACNSQETGRQTVDAVVSERALREIYLKGFEMAVKEGNAQSIMTAYNPLNGHWTASNYDLDTTILRGEWGYKGIVMTDWWATMNDVEEGGNPTIKDTRSMVRAQNDVFMVVNNNGAEINAHEDNTLEALENGKLTVGELQRCAINIIRFLLDAPAATREVKAPTILKIIAGSKVENDKLPRAVNRSESIIVPIREVYGLALEGVKEFGLTAKKAGVYNVLIKMTSVESERAQMVCTASLNDVSFSTFQINGVGGRWIQQKLTRVELEEGEYCLSLKFITPGMQIDTIEFEYCDK